VTHPRGTKFQCPECERELACYDHAPERRWRHLDSCQCLTLLVSASCAGYRHRQIPDD
jgi:transposase